MFTMLKLYEKGLQCSMGGIHREQHELIAALETFAESGQRPVVSSVYNLDNIAGAYLELTRGAQFGKIVIRLA